MTDFFPSFPCFPPMFFNISRLSLDGRKGRKKKKGRVGREGEIIPFCGCTRFRKGAPASLWLCTERVRDPDTQYPIPDARHQISDTRFRRKRRTYLFLNGGRMNQQQPADVESIDPDLDEGTRDQSTVLASHDAPIDVTDIVDGKYWKKDQLEPDDEVEVEITDVDMVQFEDKDGNPERPKPCLRLDDDKLLTLNPTNTRILAKAFGHKDNARQWIGQRVILWHDPNVTFGNSIIGGLRIRIPKSERNRVA